jgi:hypothetical protein
VRTRKLSLTARTLSEQPEKLTWERGHVAQTHTPFQITEAAAASAVWYANEQTRTAHEAARLPSKLLILFEKNNVPS